MKKAKEYYELYRVALTNEERVNQALSDLIKDLNDEVMELQKTRHVKFDRGLMPILKETNQKWNAIVRLFEKEFGASPVKPDGFKIFWINKMPELKGKF